MNVKKLSSAAYNFFIGFVFIAILFCIADIVKATEYQQVTNITQVTNVKNVTTIYQTADSTALASAMAGIDFTANIHQTQIGIAGSVIEDFLGKNHSAISFGAAYRICPDGNPCGMLSVKGAIGEKESIGNNRREQPKAATVSYMWAY